MNTAPGRLATALTLALMLSLFSGCIRRTSEAEIVEQEFLPVTQKVALSNPVGKSTITGSSDRMFNVQVRTEKRVQTYSLFGLANPDRYLDKVDLYQGINDGDLNIGVSVRRLPLFERLFVKITPKIDYALQTPVQLETDLEVNVGNLAIHNLVGDVNATVNVGEMKATSTLGVFGGQNFEVNIGNLDIQLPSDMPIRWDLETSIGSIDANGFGAQVDRQLLGARTTGASGASLTPSNIRGRVNIGNIAFHAE